MRSLCCSLYMYVACVACCFTCFGSIVPHKISEAWSIIQVTIGTGNVTSTCVAGLEVPVTYIVTVTDTLSHGAIFTSPINLATLRKKMSLRILILRKHCKCFVLKCVKSVERFVLDVSTNKAFFKIKTKHNNLEEIKKNVNRQTLTCSPR